MSKVFISHSSRDSVFAKKLAHDLLIAEIPVWLDYYELSIGDSLYGKIYSGITESDFLIVILSKNYNESIWTSKEFKAILAKEDIDQKKYLIPIKIDETRVPLEIADRIYKEFVTDYKASLRSLVRHLRREGLSTTDIPLNERQIILRFDEHTELDIQLIKSILPDLHEHQTKVIHKRQVFFDAQNEIDNLLQLGEQNVNALNDRQIKQQFQESSRRIEELRENIEEGVLLILNEYKKDCHIDLISISVYWFTKMIMDSIYNLLTRYLDLEELVRHNLRVDQFTYMPANNSMSFGDFYQTKGYARLDVFDKSDTRISCAVSVDEECFAYQELQELFFPIPFRTAFSVDFMYKYLIPQNVLSRVINGKNIHLLNSFDNYHVGLR